MREMQVLLLAGLITTAGCGRGEQQADAAAADTVRQAQEGAAAAALLTPIRGLSVAEVEFADLATRRAGMPAVRQYAQTIASDHRALIQVLDSVARTRGTALNPTRDTQELENTTRMAHSGLERVSGADFDLPFIRAEVESHRLLVDRLDQQLIPAATNPEIRTMLTDIRAMADAHLTRARQLLAQQLGQSADPQTEATRQQSPAQQGPPSSTPPPPP